MVPNLLVNGSSGIAVGMATNIPPHNLLEVADALEYLIDCEGEPELGEVYSRMPGPDFPTGGIILGRNGIVDAYRTGRGKIILRGRTTVEEKKRGKTAVVITEIPYMVNKSSLIETIASCVQEKQIDGIADIRDESDRDGLRIVLDLQRDADAELVRRQLFRRTQLQSTFGVINLALVDNSPRELPVIEMLSLFLDHRRAVVRRTLFPWTRLARAHIVEGSSKPARHDRPGYRPYERPAPLRGRRGCPALGFGGPAQAILEMRLSTSPASARRSWTRVRAACGYRAVSGMLGDHRILDGVIRDELEF